MELTEHYDKISEAARLVRQESLRDLAPLTTAHGAIEEIRVWQRILGARPEANIFTQIISGLELGLFALVSGLYRQAYGSLRLAVELTAGLAWFSTHRLDLAEWQSGEGDLVWREITNNQEGILSPRYRKAFFPELKEELKYNSLNQKLYRELSEFVHGNANTWTGPDDVKYDPKMHTTWFEKLETYMVVGTVLLSLRYLQEVGDTAVKELAPLLRARVGHVAAIAKYLDERLPLSAGLVETVVTPASAAPAAAPAPVTQESVAATEPAEHKAQENA